MSGENNNILKKIYSQRGNLLILKDGFKYSKYVKLQSGEEGWKCVEKSCRAKLYSIPIQNKTDDNNETLSELSRLSGRHTHKPLDENLVIRQSISNRLKRKTRQYLEGKPSKLLKLELDNDEEKLLSTNDLRLIKNNMYHARSMEIQKLPPPTIGKKKKKNKNLVADNLTAYDIYNYFDRTTRIAELQTFAAGEDYEQYADELMDYTCWIEPHFLATDLHF